jgi:uncharacterized RDD family membrane protein YckC
LYAGFGRRITAFVLDSLIYGLVWAVTLQLVLGPEALVRYGEAVHTEHLGVIVLENALPALVTILFWVLVGATPGKFLTSCEIRCVSTGRRPGPMRAIVRYLSYLVSALPLGLGFLWVIWDRRKQGWHDKIAGTVVVVDDLSRVPTTEWLRRFDLERPASP